MASFKWIQILSYCLGIFYSDRMYRGKLLHKMYCGFVCAVSWYEALRIIVYFILYISESPTVDAIWINSNHVLTTITVSCLLWNRKSLSKLFIETEERLQHLENSSCKKLYRIINIMISVFALYIALMILFGIFGTTSTFFTGGENQYILYPANASGVILTPGEQTYMALLMYLQLLVSCTQLYIPVLLICFTYITMARIAVRKSIFCKQVPMRIAVESANIHAMDENHSGRDGASDMTNGEATLQDMHTVNTCPNLSPKTNAIAKSNHESVQPAKTKPWKRKVSCNYINPFSRKCKTHVNTIAEVGISNREDSSKNTNFVSDELNSSTLSDAENLRPCLTHVEPFTVSGNAPTTSDEIVHTKYIECDTTATDGFDDAKGNETTSKTENKNPKPYTNDTISPIHQPIADVNFFC